MWRLPQLILVILFFIVSSCDNNRVFEGKIDFSDRYWVFDNPAEFEFEIYDSEKPHNLIFNVRNSAKYPFQNLYLQYYLEDSTGRLISKDLKNIQLFDTKTGVPYGKGIGDIFDIQKTFLEQYTFENKGKYKLRIDQFMRQDSLPEIMSVGLRVEYTE